ncbi:MAG: acyl-CoA dehydrogenase family protein [Actinomycetota bacterium]
MRTDPDAERALVALAYDFAVNEIRPVAARHDETEALPVEVLRGAARIGLTCFDLPEAYGGGGIESVRTACLIGEELAWGDSPIGSLVGSASFFAMPLTELGTEEQCRRWVPPLCTEDPPMTALAITEPGAGSDAAAITTTATRAGDGYLLNGAKTWVSGAPDASYYLVYATVAPGTRAKGITSFVVEKGDAGFTLGKKLPKMGSRCYPTGELSFTDCFVPDDRRIGEEGQAFYRVMRSFDRSRVTLAANSIGIGRAALEYAVEYAKQREAFGKKIHEFQAVSFRLVDAKMALDQARLMMLHAADLADAGEPFATEASMAKLAASEAAWQATNTAVMTLGSYGYSREYPVEKWLRDAKLEEIYEGTSDIQRLIIARSMFPRGTG